MASNFYNFAREEISSVPTFKDLDPHNEKVTIERRHKSWKKHIDHMTQSKIKKAPKRWRCVRCYSWMNEKS